ncbi:S-layer homology domain-containing protein [uncultured Oscillibacter sp.]|uniref:S-layer homology domain-containing protein n=1 Tax=uncultured Oscillibacter sp. TaxID=876091 RepID=UPI0025CD6670|nr:S-layer homology domain-containing protein [uncultured Oscillibacter sp.]
MKRFLTILLTALALTGVLCVTASASSFDGAAEELAAIGMLKGSAADGFALDKAPTRAQAAIMLVRLYGAEEEAIAAYTAGDLKCPFTDVNETAAPFAAWLADKGLASGTSETTFGASSPCTGKAYTIFLLRALGYQDNVDFTNANAQAFAQSCGLLDTSLFTGTFLRDDLVALTYQALGTDLKDGSTYLLASLIKSGAVDADAAKPITEKIEAYRALQRSGEAAAQGLDTSVDAKVGMSVTVKGAGSGTALDMTQKADAAVKGNIKMILDKELQMAMDMTVTVTDGDASETENVEYWLKDGVVYVRSGEMAYQVSTAMGMDAETLTALMEQASGKTYAAMLPFIESITTKTSGGNTVYTLVLNDAFAGMLNGLFGQILGMMDAGVDMDMTVTLGGSTITYTVGQDGTLKSAAADMTLKADLNASDGQDSLTVSAAMDVDMTMDVQAVGNDVTITFPDFSGFEEITGSADSGIIGGADGPTAIYGVTNF